MTIDLEETEREKGFGWGDLFKATGFLLRRSRRTYLGWYVLLALLQLHVLLPPYLLGHVVDFLGHWTQGTPLTPLYVYTGILAGAYATVALLRLSTKQALGNLGADAIYHARVDGFVRLSQRPLEAHTGTNAGSAAQQLQNGTNAFQRWLALLGNELILGVTSALGTMAVLATITITYSSFLLLYIALFFVLLRRSYRRIFALNREKMRALEGASGAAVEGLSNILTLKATGTENAFSELVASREALTRRYDITIRHAYTRSWMMFQVLNGVAFGSFLLLVGLDVAAGRVSPGQMVVFFGYLQAIVRSAIDLQGAYEDVLSSKAGIGRMMEIFRADAPSSVEAVPFPSSWKTLRFEDVHFRYARGGGLIGAALEIPNGARVGIVGPSGEGKSTMAKLLMRVLTPASGTIALDDLPISSIDEASYREHVAIVLQECEVFNLSLRDNITLFRVVDDAALRRAISIARLDDVIRRLPAGLDTTVGERGYELSGGERQRVGLARAICGTPDILILDEATSSLNQELEAEIQRSIETELTGTTIITIAHRLVTLRNADSIFRLEQGRFSPVPYEALSPDGK